MHADTDYIYIILALAYIIYSIIRAGEKISKNRPTVTRKTEPSTVQQPQSQSPKEKEEDTFKKVFEELFGEIPEVKNPEEPAAPPMPEPVEVKSAPAKIIPKHPPKRQLISKEKKEPFLKVEKSEEGFTHHPELVQMAFAETQQEETVETDFDIRQAVIYSEILKRPNW